MYRERRRLIWAEEFGSKSEDKYSIKERIFLKENKEEKKKTYKRKEREKEKKKIEEEDEEE